MVKKHGIYRSSSSNEIGLLCRLILFIEDVIEDAECSDIYVDRIDLDKFALKPVNCKYDVNESISIFRDRYEPIDICLGEASSSYRALYDHVIEKYEETIHSYMKKIYRETFESGIEYFTGVTFDGRFFVLEGEEGYVKFPAIPHCLSIHTHPSLYPVPSSADFKNIVRLIIDRGLGHVVVAGVSSIAIYRVKPLNIGEYEELKKLISRDPISILDYIRTKIGFLKIKYLS
uniref:Uncharacterized protein n=1 Tax=Staphylothermus marinus TaxID=2280 RepID=A0A7J3KEK3_STAMA